jgi:hypothetical protein
MESKNTRIVLSIVVIVVIACCCVCLIGGGGLWLIRATSQAPKMVSTPKALITPRVTAAPRAKTPIPGGEATPDAAITPAGEIDPDIAAEMDQIEQDVTEMRQLTANQPVTRALLSRDQLQQHVTDNFLKDYTPEEARKDTLVLSAFGLLDPNFEMLSFYKELLTEQVAGFYDNETKEMYVVQGDGFFGTERATYAHEYVHALQDQTYDLKNGLRYDNEICKKESERCAAVQALVEGDASLAGFTWLYSYGSAEDRQQILEFSQQYKIPVYDNAPEYIKQGFLFPYQQGLTFVKALFDKGGWAAVNAAYAEQPLSTEQILHPERYPDDRPLEVSLPEIDLGNGWKEIDRSTLGEWSTYLMLAYGQNTAARLDNKAASQAAAGWGGDAYAVYADAAGQKTALVLVTQWDTEQDAIEFGAALRDYANARFGAGENDTWQAPGWYSTFYEYGNQTVWVLAPESETAQTLWEAVKP